MAVILLYSNKFPLLAPVFDEMPRGEAVMQPPRSGQNSSTLTKDAGSNSIRAGNDTSWSAERWLITPD